MFCCFFENFHNKLIRICRLFCMIFIEILNLNKWILNNNKCECFISVSCSTHFISIFCFRHDVNFLLEGTIRFNFDEIYFETSVLIARVSSIVGNEAKSPIARCGLRWKYSCTISEAKLSTRACWTNERINVCQLNNFLVKNDDMFNIL